MKLFTITHGDGFDKVPEKIRGVKFSVLTMDGTGYCALFIRDDGGVSPNVEP